MRWNWEMPEWPIFYFDPKATAAMEKEFLLKMGGACAYLKGIPDRDYHQFVIEILVNEGQTSSKIEGEILNRASLQSSIKKHFGMNRNIKESNKEKRMAELLCSLYENYLLPLSNEMLWQWHAKLFKDVLSECGQYRTHPEPMQIVSGRWDRSIVFFEAPPSKKVPAMMNRFIKWYNSSAKTLPILARAAISHLYFENIHPFEDGNGRIGRALVEKALSQSLERPVLIAVSKVLEKRRKQYYKELEKCNRSLKAEDWVYFFSECICQAQDEAMQLLHFLIAKTKMLSSFAGELNTRQEKVLVRMFAEGPEGFKGGLSAENYIAITKAPRSTATRDLNDLVQKGALKKTGELRYTRYYLDLRKYSL